MATTIIEKNIFHSYKRGMLITIDYSGIIVKGSFISLRKKLPPDLGEILFLNQDYEDYKDFARANLELEKITKRQYKEAITIEQYEKSRIRCLDCQKIVSINFNPFLTNKT
ncbi:MAG: hypothetical protein ACTSRI_04945 [Promethearchaeota archaeon]